jgi:hypothetical protein
MKIFKKKGYVIFLKAKIKECYFKGQKNKEFGNGIFDKNIFLIFLDLK